MQKKGMDQMKAEMVQTIIRIMRQIADTQAAAVVDGYGLVTPDRARAILDGLAGGGR